MLVKAENSGFGYWHSIRHGSGMTNAIDAAKKKNDWLLFNLCRKDIEEVAEEVFGPAADVGGIKEWTVKIAQSQKEELFKFGADKSGAMWVEFFSEADELTEMKTNVAGIRFAHELVEMVTTHLEANNEAMLDKVTDYPADLYVQEKRRSVRISDYAPDEEPVDDSELDENEPPKRKAFK